MCYFGDGFKLVGPPGVAKSNIARTAGGIELEAEAEPLYVALKSRQRLALEHEDSVVTFNNEGARVWRSNVVECGIQGEPIVYGVA